MRITKQQLRRIIKESLMQERFPDEDYEAFMKRMGSRTYSNRNKPIELQNETELMSRDDIQAKLEEFEAAGVKMDKTSDEALRFGAYSIALGFGGWAISAFGLPALLAGIGLTGYQMVKEYMKKVANHPEAFPNEVAESLGIDDEIADVLDDQTIDIARQNYIDQVLNPAIQSGTPIGEYQTFLDFLDDRINSLSKNKVDIVNVK